MFTLFLWIGLLPTAYVVREEVIFSLCVSVHGGGVPTFWALDGGGWYLPSELWMGGGYLPSELWMGGTLGRYPPRARVGTPPARVGTPPARVGTPPSQGRYPPGQGRYPPPPEQQSVCFLRRGRYASCVHAGGLSCNLTVFIVADAPFLTKIKQTHVYSASRSARSSMGDWVKIYIYFSSFHFWGRLSKL